MGTPRYSIIIPVYNGENTIERAIKSVLNQEYSDFEIIVVENGSNDKTSKIVDSYLKDKRIKLLHSEKGVSNARNMGIDYSCGEWILFLDADDELTENSLNEYNRCIRNETDLILGKYDYEKTSGNVTFVEDVNDYICQCLNDPTKRCTSTGIAIHSKLLKNIRFNTELTHAEDSLFFLNVLQKSSNIVLLDSPIYKVNYAENSSVRTPNLNQFDAYVSTINELYKLNWDKKVQLELNAFVLNQVLIVLVNNVFCVQNDIGFSSLLKKEKEILNKEIVRNAINNVTFKYCDRSRKIVFKFMQWHWYLALALICRYKSKLNNRKELN